MGLVDEATTDLSAALSQADVVILATPVRVILRQLAEIGPLLPEGCLLMDLGSTKAQIVAAMAKLPPHVQPLGGHPMCGKETSGIEVADPAIYQGRTFILSPLPRTSPEALALGEALARAAGANPLVIDGARQDYLVATVSHLPYLLACALVRTADATTSQDPLVWKIVAGGYRDTSRVAGSDVTMMVDILMTNQRAGGQGAPRLHRPTAAPGAPDRGRGRGAAAGGVGLYPADEERDVSMRDDGRRTTDDGRRQTQGFDRRRRQPLGSGELSRFTGGGALTRHACACRGTSRSRTAR